MSSSSLRSPSRLVRRRLLSLGLAAFGAVGLGVHATAQSASAFCFGDGTSITPCPCGAFQIGAPGEGCLNSAGTGGLCTAGGAPCLTCGADTLTMTGSGLPPTTTSILIQGTVAASPEFSFGDGLRCVSGNFVRIGVLQATAGTVVFPATGAPTISARSAALGDVIPPGGVRFYQIYYRDPAALHCPPNTFNITNGQTVVWR